MCRERLYPSVTLRGTFSRCLFLFDSDKTCKGHFHGSTLQMERARLREFNSLGQDHGTSKRQSQVQPEVALLCASRLM